MMINEYQQLNVGSEIIVLKLDKSLSAANKMYFPYIIYTWKSFGVVHVQIRPNTYSAKDDYYHFHSILMSCH